MTFKKLILIFAFTSLIIWGLADILALNWIHEKIWLLQGFFFSIFFVSGKLESLGLDNNKEKFHIFYFTGMTIRFLLSIIFVFFLLYRIEKQEVVLILNFVFMYLFYTSFEIYFLIHNLRTDLNKGDENS